MAISKAKEAIYYACVEHGHWMGDAPPSTPSHVSFGFVLRCNRGCGTLRHLEIHPSTGHVTGSDYDWTKEYLAFRSSLGMTRAETRLAELNNRGAKPRRRRTT